MLTELTFQYVIRRSQRASRARIVVKPGQVEIVAPFGVPEHKLHKFVHAKQQWVTQALKKMAGTHSEQQLFAPAQFKSDETLSFQGEAYRIVIQPTKLKRIKIELDDVYRIHLPDGMQLVDAQQDIKNAVIRWLKQQTKSQVETIVSYHSQKQQLIPKTISIKTQKSRWGSCGINNDININWLLLLAPKEVLEYVVVHELCHIKEKNHSNRFWALVAEHIPDYQLRRKWLKQHGRSLMLAFAS